MLKRLYFDILNFFENKHRADYCDIHHLMLFSEKKLEKIYRGVESRWHISWIKSNRQYNLFFQSILPDIDFIKTLIPFATVSSKNSFLMSSGKFFLDGNKFNNSNCKIYFRDNLVSTKNHFFSEGQRYLYYENNTFFEEYPKLKLKKIKGDNVIVKPYGYLSLKGSGLLNFVSLNATSLIHNFYKTAGVLLLTKNSLLDRMIGLELKEEPVDTNGVTVDYCFIERDFLYFVKGKMIVGKTDLNLLKSIKKISKDFLFEQDGKLFNLPYIVIKGDVIWL